MPALIQVPFSVFQDRDGQPLENGYVWIGEPNLNPQTNPVVAYYDEALTIVAAQPLRTLNGYISRAGSPAQVYVNGVDFSILVQDSKGSMVYNFPEGNDLNAAVVAYDPAGAGAVATTVQAKLRESVSVKDFGAVGNGVADDAAAFNAAHAATPSGATIYVPPGTYYLGSTVTTTYRPFFFDAAITNGPGSIVGALVHTSDSTYGTQSFGVGTAYQIGAYYKFGRNFGGQRGLTIGGGDAADGTNGNTFFPDAYSGWTTIQPTRNESSSELTIQPSSSAGTASQGIGTNVVTRVTGATFAAGWVGRPIFLGTGTYKVASVNVGAQTLTVTTIGGGAVVFASGATVTFIVTGVIGSGICSTNGVTVTRVSGDPFVPLTNTEYIIIINGVTYTVSAVTPVNSLTLSSTAGVQTNVTYTFYTSVDYLSSALRVQRMSGAGFEEVLSIGAYASGYFHIQAASGGSLQYPLYVGTGYNGSGSKRQQLSFQTNGDTTVGGDQTKCSVLVKDRNEVASNFFNFDGSTVGGGQAPALYMRGADTNVGAGFDAQGSGNFTFTSHSFGVVNFRVTATASGTSHLEVTASTVNTPVLFAVGTAADLDVKLQPKGAGLVMLTAYTAGAPAATGYISVKDSTGTTRKLLVG